jgi:hypothetical protein
VLSVRKGFCDKLTQNFLVEFRCNLHRNQRRVQTFCLGTFAYALLRRIVLIREPTLRLRFDVECPKEGVISLTNQGMVSVGVTTRTSDRPHSLVRKSLDWRRAMAAENLFHDGRGNGRAWRRGSDPTFIAYSVPKGKAGGGLCCPGRKPKSVRPVSLAGCHPPAASSATGRGCDKPNPVSDHHANPTERTTPSALR